jgi:carbonic anhydrase
METFTNEVIRGLLRKSLSTATLDAGSWRDTGKGSGTNEGDYVDWLTISDQNESVRDDVRRIRSHPLVPRNVTIYGYIFDVKSGRFIEVEDANRIGSSA